MHEPISLRISAVGLPPVESRNPGLTKAGRIGSATRQVGIAIDWRELTHLACAMLVGLIVRLTFVTGQSFPLNDGGLFYVMIQDLQRNHFLLPATTSYNGTGIPFVYPPLGFYVTGLLANLTHWQLLGLFRAVPLAVSVLSIVAFYWLARTMLPVGRSSTYATFAFALLPMAFDWEIMGGGVTRSFGLFLSILALRELYVLFCRPNRRHLALATILAAATVLSHPEAAYFTAYSAILLWLFFGRTRLAFLHAIVVGAGTVILTSPWWLTVVMRFGLTPFRSLSDNGFPFFTGLIQLLSLRLTDESLFPLIEALALLGVIVCVWKRHHFLPIWVIATFVVQSRAADERAVIPLALLAGLGVSEVLVPLLSHPPFVSANGTETASTGGMRPAIRSDRLLNVVLGMLVLYGAVGATVDGRAVVAALPTAQLTAMTWIPGHTPTSSRFLVITSRVWTSDRVSEWFPVLAERTSIATVQGTEWLPGFSGRVKSNEVVQACSHSDTQCLANWAAKYGSNAEYLYVAKGAAVTDIGGRIDQTAALRASLAHDPAYQVVYDNTGATIYRVDSRH
ncbi:MAG TPA: hypothetical protein VMW65_13645 [Chloroflexota bacterium]|nr:hypothetical protein [Chloroflexota bacterium]